MMQSITFECEVITPMFLAGADGNTPELRVPSIKGALRFWWRALNGHLPLGELKGREGKIFGSTEYGRSKVIIQITKDMEWDGRSGAAPTPHKPRFDKSAFRPGQTFSITLTLTQKVALGGNEYFTSEDLEKLFLLTATLGGIGGRVRRGFGAFNVLSVKSPKTLEKVLELLPTEHFILKNEKIVSRHQLNNKYPYVKEIELGQSFSKHDTLLKRIGQTTSSSKKDNNDDWDYKNALGHTSKRFSSPIYVSIIQYSGQYYPIITTLNVALENGKNVFPKSSKIQKTFKENIL